MAGPAMKEIQKKIQEKDYEGAYQLSAEVLQGSVAPPLNLLIMHGTCAYQLEHYSEAEKSFRSALSLDTNGQFLQKLWKVKKPMSLSITS
jgi:Tfp pilus assembly protein PilF